jgi:LmbE family N-acetylglucosaminyl deacetylase
MAAIFLSPHYDDVALSCGGTVALLADRGKETTVVTIFGGEVIDDVLGAFARWKHSRWGLNDMDAVREQRQSEDAAATATLGAATRWLGFPDAIYRGDRYVADPELYGEVRVTERPLAEVVSGEIQSLPEWRSDATIYVPLAAGEHVDHQLVFMAGQVLARSGARVLAYEDCPYAIHSPAGLDRRVAELAEALGQPELVPVAATLERRLGAIAAYSTQVPVIFRFTHDFREAVVEFANRLVPEQGPVERFWPVLPLSNMVIPSSAKLN